MTDTIHARLRAWALQPETDGDGNRVPMGFCDECSSLRAHREHCPRADVLALLDAAPQVGTWQPTKTTFPPQSHQMVLLHTPFSQRGSVDYGYFDISNQAFMVQTMIGWEPARNFANGHEPKHWMYKPAPPAPKEPQS